MKGGFNFVEKVRVDKRCKSTKIPTIARKKKALGEKRAFFGQKQGT